jgi:UDP-N-acetylmuramyl tripeptide synthase
MLLIKNPTGADQALRSIPPGEERTDLVIGLNDAIADGRDVSWIWDTDFELLAHRDVRIWCTGRRAGELALRLKYAGVGIERILIVTDPLDAVQQAADGGEGRFWILPTYTAMFHLRERLVELGVAEAL